MHKIMVDGPVNETDGSNTKQSVPPIEVPPAVVNPCEVSRSPKDVDTLSPAGQASAGRIKEAPVCVVPELKKEAMTSGELEKMCFRLGTPVANSVVTEETAHVSCSSSSSTSSRESSFDHSVKPDSAGKPKFVRQTSDVLNAKVLSMKTSRQGRSTQRWVTDPTTNQPIRLVTGCVPIMKGGRILFVTASRKQEWILPKGGWETDETMEESAIRETFEEAGVVGVLGPKLSEVEYETRKARKRRLELEERLKNKKERTETDFSSGCSDLAHSSDDERHPPKKPSDPSASPDASSTGPISHKDSRSPQQHEKRMVQKSVDANISPSSESFERIGGTGQADSSDRHGVSDETTSISSDASATHSFVRMKLFPLYVTEVKDAWPESGRFRRVLDIDDAIQMLESRPEFRAALMEVKEKGLHLVSDPLEQHRMNEAIN